MEDLKEVVLSHRGRGAPAVVARIRASGSSAISASSNGVASGYRLRRFSRTPGSETSAMGLAVKRALASER